jgi:FtsH-binding integral membrane protein
MCNSSLYNNIFGKPFIYVQSGGKNNSRVKKPNQLIQLMYQKWHLLVLVFINLIVQIAITYYVMERSNTTINIWLLFIVQIIIICIMAFVPMPEFIKFILFCVFSYVTGLFLSGIKKIYNPDLIKIAIQGALCVFSIMVLLGIALIAGGINLNFQFGAILFWLLVFLIVLWLVFGIWGQMSGMYKLLSFIGIMLFAVYIMYDTNILLQREYNGDFITASLDYYLDILNLFVDFLTFSGR